MRKQGSKNLTYNERLQIEALLNAKTDVKVIAETIGKSCSTIYLEKHRGEYDHKIKEQGYVDYTYKFEKRYSAYIAQQKYEIACTARGAKEKIGKDYEFVNYVEKRIVQDGLSACAVLGEIKRKNIEFKTQISKQTLYRYIEKGYFENVVLNRKKRTYKSVKVAKTAFRGKSIEQRPKEVFKRQTFGHWEMDCVCGPTKPSLLVLCERLSRKLIIFRIESQKALCVVKSLNKLERFYGAKFKRIFKSITVDNGCEFTDIDGMERSIFGKGKNKRTEVFHCHPYCSSERGSNERLNREIRRKLPKGTNFMHISQEEVSAVEKWVNAYPRQVLAFASSEEIFNAELKKIA